MLIHLAICSLDGYIEDADGNFDWSEPDEEVHQFANDLMRPIGTHLYGRRLYETMAVWENDPALAEDSPLTADFAAVWRAAEKVVYSTTLDAPSTANTTIVRRFDVAEVAARKASSSTDLLIGGADLAGQALRAGLVDEFHLLVSPVLVGGGKPALPADVRLDLDLVAERRFASSGVVHLHYRLR